MLKEFKGKCVNVFEGWHRSIRAALSSLMIAAMMIPQTVFASADYVKPLNNLKTILVTILQYGGIIVAGYAVYLFGQSFRKQGQNGDLDALHAFIIAAVMIGAGTLIDLITG